MRILHTADWHLGKRLHKEDLIQDHEMFFDWLVQTVQEQKVDCLLVSGDVFDHSNPSSKARQQYFHVISRLQLYCDHIVITGGNHDSPNELNAPRELLRHQGVHVVGGMPDSMDDALIPLSREGKVELVVAAIPFLRTPDLRRNVSAEFAEDRQRRANEGIRHIYEQAAERCQQLYPGVPALAMGHLTVFGSLNPAHKTDVEVGTLPAIPADCFPDFFGYYAFGHVHRPQKIGGMESMRYSGSPIHVSFSERDDAKQVVIVDLLEGKFRPDTLAVPVIRQLKKISGTFEEVERACLAFQSSASSLTDFLELEVMLENPSMSVNENLSAIAEGFPVEKGKVLKYRITVNRDSQSMLGVHQEGRHIEDLTALEVFENKLKEDDYDPEEAELMRAAFLEILEQFEGYKTK